MAKYRPVPMDHPWRTPMAANKPQPTGEERFVQPSREVSPHRVPAWPIPEKTPVQPARHSSPGEHRQPPAGPKNG